MIFTNSKYMTAAEKQKVYNGYARFLKNGCKRTQFTKAMYRYLSCNAPFGFIAHFDIDGFYAARFQSPQGRMETVSQILDCRYGLSGDTGDLNAAILDLFRAHSAALKAASIEARMEELQAIVNAANNELLILMREQQTERYFAPTPDNECADCGEKTKPSKLEKIGNRSYCEDCVSEHKCDDCGEEYHGDGDGYDGLCGDCADKAESEGRWS